MHHRKSLAAALTGLLAMVVACGASDPTSGTPTPATSGGHGSGSGAASGNGPSGSNGGSGGGTGTSTSGANDSGAPLTDAGSGGGNGNGNAGATGGTNGGNGGSTAAYPAGPYGLDVGDVIANSSFMGYHDGTGAWTSMALADYYDPDGSRGLRALYVTLGEVGCGACVQEAPNINAWKSQYAPYGTAFLSALWRGETQNPDGSWTATEPTVDGWIAQFQITYDMVADPTSELNGGTEPVDNPNGYLVDPRTMKIVQHYPGAPGSLYGLTALLKQNGATGL